MHEKCCSVCILLVVFIFIWKEQENKTRFQHRPHPISLFSSHISSELYHWGTSYWFSWSSEILFLSALRLFHQILPNFCHTKSSRFCVTSSTDWGNNFKRRRSPENSCGTHSQRKILGCDSHGNFCLLFYSFFSH